MRPLSLFLGVMWLASGAAMAGPAWIENVEIESRDLQGALSSMVQTWSESAKEPSWIGWHVPMVEGEQVLCCWSQADRRSQDQACNLEGSHRHFVFTSERPGPLIDSDNLVILLRSVEGKIDEIQAYSDGCRLDAGGRRVLWLEGVEATESVDFLGNFVESNSAVQDEALMALALHATPAAAHRLTVIARQSPDADLRGETLFWLSLSGTASASETILQALEEDPDPEVREEAVFALSQLPGRQGLPVLLELLRDRSQPADIRQEAFFWYVQSGDEKAMDLIAEILGR